MKCTYCGKTVYSDVKVDTRRRKLGNKSLSEVDYYHTECFSLLQKERAKNEHNKKARNNKRKNSR